MKKTILLFLFLNFSFFISSYGQWQNTLKVYAVRCLAVSGNNIFLGSDEGVYISSDKGGTWTAVNSGLTNTTVFCLAVSGSNIFAGTNGGGVYRSTNNGTTWTSVNSGLTNTTVKCLAVSGSNIFAGTDGGGVCRSTNNGTNWTPVNSGLTNMYGPFHLYCLAVSGSNIFAGADEGLYFSFNSGTAWKAVNPITDVNQMTFDATGTNHATCLAVSGTNIFAGNYEGVFLSTNNGNTWLAVNKGIRSIYFTCLAVSGTNIYVGAGNGVWRSNDNGTIWTEIEGLTDAISLAVNGTTVFAGTRDGIYRWTNTNTTAVSVTPSTVNPDAKYSENENRIVKPSHIGIYRGPNGEKDYYLFDEQDNEKFISSQFGGSWKILSIDKSSGEIRVEKNDDSKEKADFGKFVKRRDGKYDIEITEGNKKLIYKFEEQKN